MELPDDVLAIIKDFSRPLTRPDWRTLHRMTSFSFHMAIAKRFSLRSPTIIQHFVTRSPGDYVFNIMYFQHFAYVHVMYNKASWTDPIYIR